MGADSAPDYCPVCGARLRNGQDAFDDHLERQADCRERFTEWRGSSTGTTGRGRPLRPAESGSILGYLRGTVSSLFVAIMGVVFMLEFVVLVTLGEDAFRTLFVLTSEHPEYVWTWVTSVFSHSPAGFTPVVGNGLILLFVGPILERQLGSKRFAALFLLGGVTAGLAQLAFGFLIGNLVPGVLGASGAILAILGCVTVLNADRELVLFFFLVLTVGYAGFTVFGIVAQGSIGGNIANAAHLMGLVVGLTYGHSIRGAG